jgi:hypothetical protein
MEQLESIGIAALLARLDEVLARCKEVGAEHKALVFEAERLVGAVETIVCEQTRTGTATNPLSTLF